MFSSRVVLSFLMALTFSSGLALADQSLSEKGAEKVKDVGRAGKKVGHRVSEAACAEGDAKCLAKKGKNRAVEGKDYVKDKASAVGDTMDKDSVPNK